MKTKTHGGKRPNAGRKPRWNQPTKVVQITVPISKVKEFKRRVEIILRDFEAREIYRYRYEKQKSDEKKL